ncbi:MAG: hypothetical protein LKE45_09170 [Olsenella sp.]|jgi:drug/metabolite transporter (DMT)-like permease|nr:hypothetical protein [Olsenella sp.]
MASSNVRYDFTKNRLALRMRVMGAVLLLAGVVYVFLAYLMYGLDAGYSTGPDTAAMAGDALVMAIGALMAVLSVLTDQVEQEREAFELIFVNRVGAMLEQQLHKYMHSTGA